MLLVKSLSVLVTVAVVVEGSGHISWLSPLLEFLAKSKQNEVLTQGGPPGFVKCDARVVCPDSFICCKISKSFRCCPPGFSCGDLPFVCNPAVTSPLSTVSADGQANYNKGRMDYSRTRDVLQPALEDGDLTWRQMTGDLQDRDGLASLGDSDEATLQSSSQDETGSCLPHQTTCRSPIGLRCCPWPHASCCVNGLYCCKAGFRCINNQCQSPSFRTSLPSDSETGATSSAALVFFNAQVRVRTTSESKPRSGFLAAKRDGPGFGTGTQTDSGASSTGDGLVPCSASAFCAQGQTCCKLTSGNWGCCPYQNATCCQDGNHCCPNGYTCGQSERSCSKNGVVLDWSLKHHAVKKEP